jgi:hypothetical protein
MKKSIVLGGSVLCLFILCSLSYQPIIADTPIENITQVKESKTSNLDVDELKEVYYKLLELKFQSKDDCGCDKSNTEVTSPYYFPIICDMLMVMLVIGYLISITLSEYLGMIICLITMDLYIDTFNCH